MLDQDNFYLISLSILITCVLDKFVNIVGRSSMLITLRPQKVKYLLSDNFALAELKNLFPLNCLMKIHYDFQMITAS